MPEDKLPTLDELNSELPTLEDLNSGLKKKPIQNASKSGGNSLKSGGVSSQGFPINGNNPEIPTVLIGDAKKEAQGIVDRRKESLTNAVNAYKAANPKAKPNATKKNPDGGVGASFMSGLNNFNEGLLKTPKFIYDLASSPQNFIAEITNTPELKADYDVVSGGAVNPLGAIDKLGDYYGENKEAYQAKVEKYDKGVFESIKSGNIKDAAEQVLNNIAQSAPSIAGMYLTGGAGNAAKLGQVGKTFVTAMPFASSKNAEIADNQEIPTWLKPIYSTFHGLSEVVYDQAFGSKAILDNVIDTFEKEGKEAALKVTKDFVSSYITKAIKKVQPITSTVKNSIEEMTTQLSQNMLDKGIVNPDLDLMEGVADAGITGGATGAGISTIGGVAAGIFNSKQKTKLIETVNRRSEIVDDLDNDNLPDTVKEELATELERVNDSITKQSEEAENKLASLPEKERLEAQDLQATIAETESSLSDESLSEGSREKLTEYVSKLQDKLDVLVEASGIVTKSNPQIDEQLPTSTETTEQVRTEPIESETAQVDIEQNDTPSDAEVVQESQTPVSEEQGQLEPEITLEEPTIESTQEAESTTLRNTDVEQKRKDYGFDKPVPRKGSTDAELEAKADKLIADGIDVYELMDGIIKDKKPISGAESVVLAKFQGTKESQIIDFNRKIEEAQSSGSTSFDNLVKERDKAVDALMMAYDASESSGTVASDALRARKVKVLQDFSLANMLIRKRKANNNERLSQKQFKEISDQYKDLTEANVKLEQKLAQLEEENSKLKAKEYSPKLRREAALESRNKKRVQTKETLKKERDEIFDEIRKLANKSRGTLSANPIPIEMIPLVGKLAKNYFLAGTTSIEAIVDNIHAELVDVVEGVTKRDVRDAISGYGKDVRPSKDELLKDIRDLKQQAELISRIEDAESGVKRAKSPTERTKASDKVQELRARLKDLTVEDVRLESLKGRVGKNIKELQKKIANKDYSKKESTEIQLDDEAKKLQEQYRKIKFDFEVALKRDELARRTDRQKIYDNVVNVLNVPRALMASFDFSAPLRQAIVPTVANPMMASKAFVEMMRQWASEGKSNAWLSDLKESDGYHLMQKSGLYISDKNNAEVTAKEEEFMTNLAEKIPLVGWGIKASERAYVGYLNKMRVDLFTQGVEMLQLEGINSVDNINAYKALATYVNAQTGRGSLGMLETSAPILNTLLFSPRLMASRLQLLSGYPFWKKDMPTAVKKMYFNDMYKFVGFGVAVIALASLNDEVEVEDDPRSSDFGKIRVGDTRWDIWGGYQQYIRFFTQFISGESKSTTTGKVSKFGDSPSAKIQDRVDLLLNFGRSKLAPVPALGVTALSGTDMIGKPFNPNPLDIEPINENIAFKTLIPLVIQGGIESYKDQGVRSLFTATVPSLFGVSVQTYRANDFLSKGVDDKLIKLLGDKKATAFDPDETQKIFDIKTGEEREMSSKEFKNYYDTWVSNIKEQLNSDYNRLSKLETSKFEKEFRSIKLQATKEAKLAVSGVESRIKKIELDGEGYDLPPAVIQERKQIIDEYLKENKADLESNFEDSELSKVEVQNKIRSMANSYSKSVLVEKYLDEDTGRLEFNK